jgi:hypothetical protein
MNLYRKILDRAIEYFKATIRRDQFTSDAAWLRTCKAKAFDEARYALPTSIKTSLGATLPTRETERWITKMLAHPEKEIRDIAALVKQECVKVNPGLLRHVDANPYLHQRSLDISETVRKKALEGIKSEENRTGMSLITRANDPVAVLTAFCADIGLHTPGEISAAGDESLSELMDSILRSRGLFDAMPNWTAAGELEFCITIDIGAYRDIQRHRVYEPDVDATVATSSRSYVTPQRHMRPSRTLTSRIASVVSAELLLKPGRANSVMSHASDAGARDSVTFTEAHLPLEPVDTNLMRLCVNNRVPDGQQYEAPTDHEPDVHKPSAGKFDTPYGGSPVILTMVPRGGGQPSSTRDPDSARDASMTPPASDTRPRTAVPLSSTVRRAAAPVPPRSRSRIEASGSTPRARSIDCTLCNVPFDATMSGTIVMNRRSSVFLTLRAGASAAVPMLSPMTYCASVASENSCGTCCRPDVASASPRNASGTVSSSS